MKRNPVHVGRLHALQFAATALFLLAAAAALRAQATSPEMPPTNLEMLSACARTACDSALMQTATGTALCAEVIRHPASWVVENALPASAEARGVNVLACDSTAALTLALRSIGVVYGAIDGDDEHLERTATLQLSAVHRSKAAAGTARTITVVARDTVPSAAVPTLDGSGYDFARGVPPPASGGGFWSKVLEPAVVVGASVVMTILFFTVRSQ